MVHDKLNNLLLSPRLLATYFKSAPVGIIKYLQTPRSRGVLSKVFDHWGLIAVRVGTVTSWRWRVGDEAQWCTSRDNWHIVSVPTKPSHTCPRRLRIVIYSQAHSKAPQDSAHHALRCLWWWWLPNNSAEVGKSKFNYLQTLLQKKISTWFLFQQVQQSLNSFLQFAVVLWTFLCSQNLRPVVIL